MDITVFFTLVALIYTYMYVKIILVIEMIKSNKEIIYHEKGKDALFKTWHCSEEVIILYVHKGSGSIVCSEKAYPLKEGALCLIGAGKFHYTMPEEPENYERSKLFLSKEQFSSLISLTKNDLQLKKRDFIYAEIEENHRKYIENIFDELHSFVIDFPEHIKTFLNSSVLSLMVYIDKYMLENSLSASGFMASAIEYINSNISYEITIEEICRAVHMSKYYFCRQFKKYTGMTVMNYVLKTRITLAKDMLINSENSITDVSTKCGFSSVSYFCRVFKEESGLPPLQFRKQKQ